MRIRTFLLVATLALPGLAAAQWQWIDPNGRRVYSDQPPPPGTPERNILRQPARRAALPESSPPPAEAPAVTPPAAGAPRAAASDREQEARRRQAQAAEAEKRRAEEERIARLRAENCTRARSAKATLDSGVRLARTNDKGEREILDDAARAEEGRRLQDIIDSDCGASGVPAGGTRPAP